MTDKQKQVVKKLGKKKVLSPLDVKPTDGLGNPGAAMLPVLSKAGPRKVKEFEKENGVEITRDVAPVWDGKGDPTQIVVIQTPENRAMLDYLFSLLETGMPLSYAAAHICIPENTVAKWYKNGVADIEANKPTQQAWFVMRCKRATAKGIATLTKALHGEASKDGWLALNVLSRLVPEFKEKKDTKLTVQQQDIPNEELQAADALLKKALAEEGPTNGLGDGQVA